MNDTPAAWVIDMKMTDDHDNFIWNTGDYPDWQVKDWTPLYTHLVKELTDEKIIDIADTYDWHKDCAIEFARAILRKAQEK